MPLPFMPHSMCVNGNSLLIKLMNSGDSIIALSYIFASFALLYICWKQWLVFRGISRWFIFSYGLFIISCAATHVMDVIVFYYPHYWFQAWVVLWTAVVAVPITMFTIKVVPWFVGLAVAPEDLSASVNGLQIEIAEVRKLQGKVDRGNLSVKDHDDLCALLREAAERVERHSQDVNHLVAKTLSWEEWVEAK